MQPLTGCLAMVKLPPASLTGTLQNEIKIMKRIRISAKPQQTQCHGSRSFGNSTIVAALRTCPPSNRSYGCAIQSGQALRTSTTALPCEVSVRDAA